MTRRIPAGMVTGPVVVALRVALGVAVMPVILVRIGVDAFGFYALAASLLEIATACDFGLSTALVKLLAESDTVGRVPEQALLRTGQTAYRWLAVAWGALGVVAAATLPGVLSLKPDLAAAAGPCFLMMGGEAAAAVYGLFFRSALQSRSEYARVNAVDGAAGILKAAASVAGVLAGLGLPGLFAARLAITALWTFALRRASGALDLSTPEIGDRRSAMRALAGHGTCAGVTWVAAALCHKADAAIIAAFLPLSAVAGYDAVFRLLSPAFQTVFRMNEGAAPLYARFCAGGEIRTSRELFLRMSALTAAAISTFLLAAVWLYAPLFEAVTLGRIALSGTYGILAVAVPILWSTAMQMPASAYLFAAGRRRHLAITSAACALANVTLSLALVHPLGVVGVALGTLLPALVQHQVFLIVAACRDMGVPLRRYIVAVHVKAVPGLAAAAVALAATRPLVSGAEAPFMRVVAIGAAGAVALGASATVWFALSTTREQRGRAVARAFAAVRRAV